MRVFSFSSTVLLLSALPVMASATPVKAGVEVSAQQHNLKHMVSTTDEQNLGAENFISSVAKRGIDFLSDPSLTPAKQKAEFSKLLNNSFDINTIARFSMGRYWRSASSEQRGEYLDLFKNMIINVYSDRFGEYNGQQLEVTGSRSQGSSDIIVSSVVTGDGQPTVKVDWRVRYKNGQYKIIDIIVEGVSMALTHRADFASVIQRGGGNVNVLLVHLRN